MQSPRKYALTEILTGIFICSVVIFILDTMVNIDNYANYCCCNPNMVSRRFNASYEDSLDELLKKNAFCVFHFNNRTENPKYIGFKNVVIKMLQEFGVHENNMWIIKLYKFVSSNNYCNMISEKEMYGIKKTFWQENCFSIIAKDKHNRKEILHTWGQSDATVHAIKNLFL